MMSPKRLSLGFPILFGVILTGVVACDKPAATESAQSGASKASAAVANAPADAPVVAAGQGSAPVADAAAGKDAAVKDAAVTGTAAAGKDAAFTGTAAAVTGKAAAAAGKAAAVAGKAAPTMADAGRKLSDAADTALSATMASYERIRKQLVGDKLEEVKQSASELAASAQKAAGQAHGAMKQKLSELSKAADAFQAKSSARAVEVRKAYGEVSRAIVNLVSGDPELKKELKLYECPMAPGYDKWVQPDDKIANPYMGQAMPECGAKTHW